MDLELRNVQVKRCQSWVTRIDSEGCADAGRGRLTKLILRTPVLDSREGGSCQSGEILHASFR